MAFTLFIVPLLISISGFLMYKYPPKRINYFIGYRTRKSMKNDKNWKILNQYCGKIWIILGLILLVFAIFIVSLILFKIIILTEMLLMIIVILEVLIVVVTSCFIEMKVKD